MKAITTSLNQSTSLFSWTPLTYLFNTINSFTPSLSRTENNSSIKSRKKINPKKVLPLLILVVFIGSALYIFGRIASAAAPRSGSGDNRVSVSGPKATQSLGKEFKFPLTDSKGKTLTEIKFTLDNVELRDEIVVKGKLATAVQGRTFLILTLKIASDYTKGLQINSKDYFRLTVNNNKSDLLAPDINNDPVIVEPTSTKFTRVGWAINDSDSQLNLLVGEISGEKTSINLSF